MLSLFIISLKWGYLRFLCEKGIKFRNRDFGVTWKPKSIVCVMICNFVPVEKVHIWLSDNGCNYLLKFVDVYSVPTDRYKSYFMIV